MTPTLSEEATHESCTAKGEVADGARPVGADGGVLSVLGPRRVVPKAASSRTTSQVPVAGSPTCSWPMAVAVTAVDAFESPETRTPSSQISTVLAAPLRPMWSSSECQPEPTTAVLDVLTAVASSWKPRNPPAVTYT